MNLGISNPRDEDVERAVALVAAEVVVSAAEAVALAQVSVVEAAALAQVSAVEPELA